MNTIRGLYRSRIGAASEGTILGLFAVVCFGMTLPCTRIAVPLFGAYGVTAIRAALAGLVAALILFVQRAPWPSRAAWRELVVVALGTVLGFPLFAALSMNRAPASHGAVVMALVPPLTAIVGSRLESERLPVRFWVASAAGSACVAVFALRGAPLGLAAADVFLVLGAVSAAIGYAYGGRLARELGGARVICWALVLCLPLSLLAAALEARPIIAVPPAGVALAMLYLALVSQLGGFFLWNRALAVGGIARVSQTQLMQPFVTIVGAALVAGEPLHPELIGFAALVAASVALGRSRGRLNLAPRLLSFKKALGTWS